jgi:hypothetical protein
MGIYGCMQEIMYFSIIEFAISVPQRFVLCLMRFAKNMGIYGCVFEEQKLAINFRLAPCSMCLAHNTKIRNSGQNSIIPKR